MLFNFADDIERQIVASNAKLVIGTPKTYANLKKVVENLKRDIKILCIKTEAGQAMPDGAIDFAEAIDTNSKRNLLIILVKTDECNTLFPIFFRC